MRILRRRQGPVVVSPAQAKLELASTPKQVRRAKKKLRAAGGRP